MLQFGMERKEDWEDFRPLWRFYTFLGKLRPKRASGSRVSLIREL